jgi:cellulose synthase/poly-beta-1,6-N-acetylglucosamine synthase-like glycosyltransferase
VRAVVEPTPGATRTRNTAARAARGEVLAFIDDDAIPRPGWLAAIVAPFADPHIGAAGGRVLLRFPGPPPRWWDGSLADYLSRYHLGLEPINLGTRPWYESPRGANMAVRRAALLEVGGFNLRLGPRAGRPSVGEESDLCLRLLARGYRILYVPDSVVDHLIDPARLAPAWFFRRAFWNGWSEAIISLAHRPLRKVLGLIRWHYRYRAFRLPYRPAGEPNPDRLRAECERREAWGYILGVLRYAPVRGQLVRTEP